ncbi:MAG: hypothetical protein AAFN78_18775 [Pseudomonadota bacterium]
MKSTWKLKAGPPLLGQCMLSVALALGTISEARAQDSEWEHALAVYLWAAGIDGRTASGQDVDVDFDTLLDALEIGGMASYQARKGKWSFLGDIIYMELSDSQQLDLLPPVGPGPVNVTTDTTADVEGLIFQAAAAYNVAENGDSRTDIVFGARYLDLSTDITLDFNLDPAPNVSRQLSTSGDALDAFVGVKGNVALSERWFLPYYVDIGAGDSEFTWQALGGVAFKASSWADITLVYRHIDWDLDGGGVDDISFSGAALGVIFRF